MELYEIFPRRRPADRPARLHNGCRFTVGPALKTRRGNVYDRRCGSGAYRGKYGLEPPANDFTERNGPRGRSLVDACGGEGHGSAAVDGSLEHVLAWRLQDDLPSFTASVPSEAGFFAPEPRNPGEHFRPDGHYLRSACFCVLGPSGRPPSPDTPPPEQRAYKLRQQPVANPRVRRLPWGSFLWRINVRSGNTLLVQAPRYDSTDQTLDLQLDIVTVADVTHPKAADLQ
jgi:hypothetical protein